MASWAGKSVVAFQMLHRELGVARIHPTPLQIDASAVTDGVQMERVSRQQRFQAARLAMLRFWQEERVLKLLKTDTEDMRAIFSPNRSIPAKNSAPNSAFFSPVLLHLPIKRSLPLTLLSLQRLAELRGGANEEDVV